MEKRKPGPSEPQLSRGHLERRYHASVVAASKTGQLTPRQNEVSLLVIDGFSNKDIAEELGISVHTLGVICHNIYDRLDLCGWGNPRVRLTRLLLAGQEQS